MLIYDNITKQHNIRIKGNIETTFRQSELNSPDLPEQIENRERARINASLAHTGFHIHIYIQDKAGKNYVLWLGKTGTEPRKNWWEGYKKI